MHDLSRIPRIVGTVAIAIGLLEMLVASVFVARAWSWHAGTTTAAGTVIRHEASGRRTAGRGPSRPTYAEVVRFTDASGAPREFKSWIATSQPFAVGESVGVRYTAADPADAVVDSWFRIWGFPLLFVGAGAVFALLGLAFRGVGSRIGRAGA